MDLSSNCSLPLVSLDHLALRNPRVIGAIQRVIFYLSTKMIPVDVRVVGLSNIHVECNTTVTNGETTVCTDTNTPSMFESTTRIEW
jgi:hypothetical protein